MVNYIFAGAAVGAVVGAVLGAAVIGAAVVDAAVVVGAGVVGGQSLLGSATNSSTWWRENHCPLPPWEFPTIKTPPQPLSLAAQASSACIGFWLWSLTKVFNKVETSL